MNYKKIKMVLVAFFVLLLAGASFAQPRPAPNIRPVPGMLKAPGTLPFDPVPDKKEFTGIKTIKSLVPYEDLYKVLQQDVGKYFILPVEEYEELKAAKEASLQSKMPEQSLPPKAFQIESARFEGKIRENFAIINGYYRIETFTDKWHEVPLLTGSLGIKSAKLNGVDSTIRSNGIYKRSARIVNYAAAKNNLLQQAITKGTVRRDNLSQKNWQDSLFSIPINGKGTHECRITFLVPIDNQNDIFNMQFGLAPVPLVFMQYSTENFLMAVESTNFQDYTVTKKDPGTSNFIGWLGANSEMKLSWRRRYARPDTSPAEDVVVIKDTDEEGENDAIEALEELVEEIKPVIIEPLVYARSNTIVTIDETRIIGHKTFEYTISKAAISSFTFLLPENAEIISVVADRNHSQRQIRDGSERKLIVDFMTGRENSCKIEIGYEAPVDLTNPVIGIPEIKPLNIERELGTMAIEALASVEVQPGNTEAKPLGRGIHPLDPVEVPQFLKNKTDRTILLAYRHNISPTGILVAIKRYEDVPQQTIVADSFDAKTTFTTNQTSNTLLNLRIRNNNRQYLYLTLASGSEVVSAFAGNTALNPLTSLHAHKNRVQIPLEMSSVVGQPVEMDLQILVKQPVPELDWRGKMDFQVPLIDVPVSRFNWSLYAPEDFYLFDFNGTVKQTQESKPPFFFRGFVDLMKLARQIVSEPSIMLVAGFFILVFMLVAARNLLFAIAKAIWNFFGGIFSFVFGGGGFRLIELMIVIAIIALLAAMSMPNFRKSRVQARQKACQANQRVILGAVEMYNMEQEQMMKDLRLDLLLKHKYLRSEIQPPTSECSYYSSGDLRTNGIICCRVHGSVEQPTDPAQVQSIIASKARSHSSRRESSGEDFMTTSARLNVDRKSMSKPVTDSFGAAKTPGMRPIRSRFVVTTNHYNLSRDLVISETNDEGGLVANLTSPSVQFCYLNVNFIRVGKVLAFVMAFFSAIYFVAGAVLQVNSKLWLAALFIVLLSVIDLKLEAYGESANAGFWLAILMAFIWKTIWLISKYKDCFALMPDKPTDDESKLHADLVKDETSPDSHKSGRVSAAVMLLVILFAFTVFSLPAFALDMREIRVMAPFRDITKVIPANDRVVIIPESDYEYLRNIIASPEPQNKAPQDYSFESVHYQGIVNDNGVRFKARYRLDLFNDGWKQVELLSRSAVPSYASVNGQPLSLSLINNSYGFMTSETGAKEILVDFFVPLISSEFGHTSNFTLPTLPVGVSSLQISVKDKDSEVWIDPGILLPATRSEDKSVFNAILPPTSHVNVELYRNMISATAKPEKIEKDYEEFPSTEKPVVIEEKTRVNVSAVNLLSLREGFVSGINNFDLKVVGGSGVDSVEFLIPDGFRILKVEGLFVDTWNVSEDTGSRVLDILFKSRARGDVKLSIEYEEDVPDLTEAPYDVREIVLIGAEQSYGLLGIGCLQSLEVSVESAPQGYSPIVPPEFLKSWMGEVPEKTPYAFRFLRHPNSLVLTVSRPKDISLQTAVIDKAEAMTLISAEGFVLTRVVYEVKNNSQQFLKVKLPQIGSNTTELWSTQVAGQSVRAGYDEDKDVYNLPIIRSPIRNGESKPFPVEIVYAIRNKVSLRAVQQTYLELPAAHLSISELSWVLYLPEGYELMREDGNVDRIDGWSQIKFLDDPSYFAVSREIQKRSQRSMQMQQVQVQSPIAESQKQRVFGMAGILPVKFTIPTTSWQTNFSMLQIDPEGKPPHIRGMLVNPGKDRGFLFQLIMILIGVIAAIALVRTFSSAKKFRWFLVLGMTVVAVSSAFYLKLYQADQFVIMGFATTFGLFVLYRFFKYKPLESKED